MLHIYFDGACGPKNDGTGHMGVGVVAYNVLNSKSEKLFEKALYLPYTAKYEKLNYGRSEFSYLHTSNNLAEHLALFHALRFIYATNSPNKIPSINVFGDSLMVINQMNSIWNINDGKPYSEVAKRNKFITMNFLNEFDINFKWIAREKNTVADELSKIACEKKLSFEKTL